MPISKSSTKDNNKEEIKGAPLLWNTNNIVFNHPIEDVYTAALPISGCAWIDTKDGYVLIDTMVSTDAGKKVAERIKGTIKYIIYTHGHNDHVRGASVFMKDNPEVIANKYLADRLDKYKRLTKFRARITAQQFDVPEQVAPTNYVYPTISISGEKIIKLGNKTFELYTARAETDDVCWVYVPEIQSAFIGDLIIGSFPNIGNPWKPTRFALGWAKALEKVREKDPQYLFFNGAGMMLKGKRVKKVLDANIEVIHSLYDQVINYINQDVPITEMIHKVKIPEHLKKNAHLKLLYSKPEFFTYNVYRWYHGYFDGNIAHLLPRPEKEVNNEIFDLIGDSKKILNRAEELYNQGKFQLSLQVIDVLYLAAPENVDARKLRIKLLTELGLKDYCLMSRNAWLYYINKDKEFLKSKGIDI